jgi:hypothetical protein
MDVHARPRVASWRWWSCSTLHSYLHSTTAIRFHSRRVLGNLRTLVRSGVAIVTSTLAVSAIGVYGALISLCMVVPPLVADYIILQFLAAVLMFGVDLSVVW